MTTVLPPADKWVPELTFGARLALVRHRMGWNIKEAAAACGVPAQSWRGWEVDGHLPRRHVEIARQISVRTGVDYFWLVLGPDRGEGGTTHEPERPGLRVIRTADTDITSRFPPAAERTEPATPKGDRRPRRTRRVGSPVSPARRPNSGPAGRATGSGTRRPVAI
jgi:hypothetical protein